MQSNQAENRRKLLKIWFIKHEKKPADLAAALNVSVSIVNGWKSNKPIPPERWAAIESYFRETEHPKDEQYRAIGISVTETQHRDIVAAADKERKSIDLFARDAVLEKVLRILNPPA